MGAEPGHRPLDEAARLWAQRRRLLSQPWLDAASLDRLERRLRVHLSLLADLDGPLQDPPESPDPATVHWMAALLGDPERSLAPALEAAAGGDAPAAAAREALILVPAFATAQRSAGLSRISARGAAVQVSVAAQAGLVLPDALVNTALAADDEATRVAAIETAAGDPGRPAGFFHPWYQSADGAAGHAQCCAALHAGLLRGDTQAQRALGPVLQQAADDHQSNRVLRLMALAGSDDHGETLRLYARREPVRGARLLALHGAPAHLDTLLELMARPEAAAEAALAWWRLTGAMPPRVPRLRSLDGATAGGGEIPDVQWAEGWLRCHRDRLAAAPRLLQGRALDEPGLARACRDWAGAAGAHALDQARMLAGPALKARPAQWLALRRRHLEAAGLRDQAEPPPELAGADPWEHGHYA